MQQDQQPPVQQNNNKKQQDQMQNQQQPRRIADKTPGNTDTSNVPRVNKPSCRDCENKTCKSFKEEDLSRILTSIRSTGAL